MHIHVCCVGTHTCALCGHVCVCAPCWCVYTVLVPMCAPCGCVYTVLVHVCVLCRCMHVCTMLTCTCSLCGCAQACAMGGRACVCAGGLHCIMPMCTHRCTHVQVCMEEYACGVCVHCGNIHTSLCTWGVHYVHMHLHVCMCMVHMGLRASMCVCCVCMCIHMCMSMSAHVFGMLYECVCKDAKGGKAWGMRGVCKGEGHVGRSWQASTHRPSMRT